MIKDTRGIEHGHDFRSHGRCWGCGMKSLYWSEVLYAYSKGNFDYDRLTDFFCESVKPKKTSELDPKGEEGGET